MKVKNLYKFVTSTFTGEKALKSEKSSTLWNPISNNTVDNLGHPDGDGSVGRYSSTKELLME